MKCVQTPIEYFEDLISHIEKSKKSVFLQTMIFEYGELFIGKLEKELIKASLRGIDIRVNYDWVARKYIHGELPLIPIFDKKRRKYSQSLQIRNKKMYERLESAGVKLTQTNNPTFPVSQMPYLGRNHIKMAVVDDYIAWIGGVNLYDGAFEYLDIMVKSHKPNLILALSSQFFQVNSNKSKNDYKEIIDETETLYVDTGIKGKSIIYDQAKERIRNASKSIIFMSQFVPDTKLLNEIEVACDRGVEVSILTSPADNPNFTNYPEKLTYIILKKSIAERPSINLTHLSKKVHAKILIIDDEIVLFGSHNYTYTGVLFGTAEIMVETSDEKILMEFREYIKDNIKVV